MAAVAGNPSVTCGDSSAQGTPFGCPKGEPRNTNLQTPYEIKLPACTRKHLNITLPIQARATTGVGKPQADSEGNERIPPDGFDMTALEVALRGRILPPPSGDPPRTERSPLPCGHLPTPWGVTLFKGGLYTACKRRKNKSHPPAPEST